MLKAIEEDGKKLSALSRAALAAEFTEEALDAKNGRMWQKAYTLLEAALTLQPRRENARKRLGEVKSTAPPEEKFSPADPDSETLGGIRKRIRRTTAEQADPGKLAFKQTTLRARAWEKKYPFSLAFGAVFIVWMSAGILLHGIAAMVRGNTAGPAYLVLSAVTLAAGYFLVRRKLAGLVAAWAVTLIVFACFWMFFSHPPETARPAFFLGCLPSFLLIIMLAINTRGIIRHHMAADETAARH